MDYINEGQSVLFYDWENSGNKEAMMDYGLAYTFKMAEKHNHFGNKNEPLFRTCRKILSKLIFPESIKDTDNIHIQTNFECEHIDLTVEVYKDGNPWQVVIIENKVESPLKNDLRTYKCVAHMWYEEEHKNEGWATPHYFVIVAYDDYRTSAVYQKCKDAGFEVLTMDELLKNCCDTDIDGKYKDTGNVIFDEFWFRDW